jgi:hypothetical protein
LFAGTPDHYQELDDLSAQLDSDPTSQHLRDLLNCRADASHSFYKMALVGACFAKHPEIFRAVSKDLRTDQERESMEGLASLGTGVFEYHPELKPADFERHLESGKWLEQFRNKSATPSEVGTPSN